MEAILKVIASSKRGYRDRCTLMQFFQPVDERIPVHIKQPGQFQKYSGYYRKCINGCRCFPRRRNRHPAAEYFIKKQTARLRGKLIDQPVDTETLIADDTFVGIKDLAHLK